MEPATGVEPATYWLQISCAANCATPAEKGKEFGEQFQSHASSMELHNLGFVVPCATAELVLRVFHLWGRYCLHLTFSACLRTHGPGDGNRNHIRGLEDRYSSRWTTPSYISWILSQPCINIIPRFSRKIKFSHSKTYKLELWFEVAARNRRSSFLWPRNLLLSIIRSHKQVNKGHRANHCGHYSQNCPTFIEATGSKGRISNKRNRRKPFR